MSKGRSPRKLGVGERLAVCCCCSLGLRIAAASEAQVIYSLCHIVCAWHVSFHKAFASSCMDMCFAYRMWHGCPCVGSISPWVLLARLACLLPLLVSPLIVQDACPFTRLRTRQSLPQTHRGKPRLLALLLAVFDVLEVAVGGPVALFFEGSPRLSICLMPSFNHVPSSSSPRPVHPSHRPSVAVFATSRHVIQGTRLSTAVPPSLAPALIKAWHG